MNEDRLVDIPQSTSVDMKRLDLREMATRCPVTSTRKEVHKTVTGSIEVGDALEEDQEWNPWDHHYRDAGYQNAIETAESHREAEGIEPCLDRSGEHLEDSRAKLRALVAPPPPT